jgi:hypothetical protein
MVRHLPSRKKRNVTVQEYELQHLEVRYMSEDDGEAVDALECQLSTWQSRKGWSNVHDVNLSLLKTKRKLHWRPSLSERLQPGPHPLMKAVGVDPRVLDRVAIVMVLVRALDEMDTCDRIINVTQILWMQGNLLVIKSQHQSWMVQAAVFKQQRCQQGP